MVLQNYVILAEGVPAKLHFIGHIIETRDITDPVTGRPKAVRALVFDVDELNGKPTQARYSTISEKHASQFAPFLEKGRYINYNFSITQLGRGFAREYQLKVEPR